MYPEQTQQQPQAQQQAQSADQRFSAGSLSVTNDTIVALATPPGVSALAIIRVSGPQSVHFLQQLTAPETEPDLKNPSLSTAQPPVPQPWPARRARHVTLRYRGELLDDVVATAWFRPNSPTGEDVVEISCHGNPLIIKRIISALLRLGARSAQPGEFTQRAFLSGRMDLTQAEAVLDLIHAGSDRALAGARAMKDGRLGLRMRDLRTSLINLLAHLEAYIDFPEEDIAPDTGEEFLERIATLRVEVQRLIATAPLGRVLREGALVAIVGEPNTGKSSLLNAMLRENRAIVSPTPGTTRDYLEADCHIRGLSVRLVDTAGHRATSDPIEAEGVKRAEEVAARAHVILHLMEAHRAAEEQNGTLKREDFPEAKAYVRVANKADLGRHPSHSGEPGAVFISATLGEGLSDLEAAIESALHTARPDDDQGWLTVNARQEAALATADASLAEAEQAMREGAPPELVSVDLRAALHSIGEVIGLATTEDILDQLFKNFCIGK